MEDIIKTIFSASDTDVPMPETAEAFSGEKRAAWKRGLIRVYLDDLPKKYRPVMRARYEDGLTVTATAKRLGMTERQVRKLEEAAGEWVRLHIEINSITKSKKKGVEK